MTERGQALIETSLVIVGLVLIALGVMEGARIWHLLGTVSHAVRDGARAAAVVPTSQRDPNGIILPGAAHGIEQLVVDEVSRDCDTKRFNNPTILQHAGTPPTVTVRLQGSIPLLFGIFGASLPIDKSVTFADAGR